MSRSVHRLLSEAWYGAWARMFRLDRRANARVTRKRRDADRKRVDEREVERELRAAQEESNHE